MDALLRMFLWLLKKLTLGVVILGLGLLAAGLWVFVHDSLDFDLRRSELVRTLTGEMHKLEQALADVDARMAANRTETAAQEQRARDAAKVAEELERLNSGINRVGADPVQVKENDLRLGRMRKMEAESRDRVADLKQALERAQWERDGLEIALGKMRDRRETVEREKSRVMHYAREAWERYGRGVVVLAVVYFVGPPVWRVFAFFVLAPAISRRASLRLAPPGGTPPGIEPSRASVDVEIPPGESVWVKERFLQASDEGLRKRTRTVLDWGMPLASAAAGLVELVEMSNASTADTYRATFSSQSESHVELGVIRLEAGGSLVIRPRFLAGLIGGQGRPPAVRRHWRLFRLHSWITGQFSYFEFEGPCRLLLAGSRGVRAEVIKGEGEGFARRANREVVIGFTPGLTNRPVRAETLWAYLRGMNPLFDDRFEGAGVFLCQESSAADLNRPRRRFLARVWDGALRLAGI